MTRPAAPSQRRCRRLPTGSCRRRSNNVIKHAGPANALITIEQQPETLTVTVRDGGSVAPSARDDGQGNGLRGMRERAVQVGGTLQAGPGSEGGWNVQARLPVDAAGVT